MVHPSGITANHDDGCFRRKDFGSFRHEAHPADDQCLRLGGGGFDAQFEGITAEIGNFLNFSGDLIMGKNKCVALFAELIDFFNKSSFIHFSFLP